jgi:LDH2 family malate/lactate/ureidoglycolate dehydrogenase
VAELDRFCRAVLSAVGADEETADAATRAMMHGSRLGIDSHGVRLLAHYATALTHGRVNPRPKLRLVNSLGAVATLDADDAHGARAAYFAMEEAMCLARASGIGAVAIRNSSHFGSAGAYALAAAEAGMIGLAMCNSDSFVRLHDGAQRFHGTNPIACGAPVAGGRPWLFDMATSAIPYNRIQLYKSLGLELPQGTASDAAGEDTEDADRAEMLAPLGGPFGFKGAGLAGMAEIFSAVLTGMRLSFEIAPMGGPDFSTPRGLGAFVLAMNQQAWDPLSPAQQEAIEGLTGEALAMRLAEGHQAAADETEATYWPETGVESIELAEDEFGRMREAVQPVFEQWIQEREGEGVPGQAMADRLFELTGAN